MAYNLLVNGVYWGYNPLSNLLITNFMGHPSIVYNQYFMESKAVFFVAHFLVVICHHLPSSNRSSQTISEKHTTPSDRFWYNGILV